MGRTVTIQLDDSNRAVKLFDTNGKEAVIDWRENENPVVTLYYDDGVFADAMQEHPDDVTPQALAWLDL